MPERAKSWILCAFLASVGPFAGGGVIPVAAQLPSPSEARRLVNDDPELIRQRLLESGLSETEIRARLTALGYPSTALDGFLASTPTAAAVVDADAVAALRALGLIPVTPDGVELVEVTSGLGTTTEASDTSTGLPVFGHDVFTRATSLFQPLLSGPVSEEYRLGPGDNMVLLLSGDVQLAHELTVTSDGFVVVPNVGQLSVANLSMREFRTALRQRLVRAYSGIERGTTTISVTVTQLRTIQVYLSGQVSQPGAYQLASVATVMNALYAAGGPTELGNLRSVQVVRRRTGEELSLDLYPYLLEGDVSADVGLEQGDYVFIPLKGRRVQLHGAVVRPAIYEILEGEDLADVLAAAGGFSPDAYRDRIAIHRVLHPGDRGPGLSVRSTIDVELTQANEGGPPGHTGGVVVPPVGLQDGDSIVIGRAPALSSSYYVSVAGMVARPDTFPWREGMTIRDVILLARGPTVGADLRHAEVSRLPDDRMAGELADRLLVPLDSSYLSQRSSDGRYAGPPGVQFPPAGATPDFVLEPFDQVLVRRQPDFAMPTTVTVTGEVPVPGAYTLLTKEDRVSDLIERASGLLSTGYPEGARLYRALDGLGRIDLNLPSALASPHESDDLILQPGDSLHIPVYSPTVRVTGAVNSPVTVLYRPGEDFDYYIANAGGYRNDADKGRISVRYANGQAQTRSKFLFWASYPTPGPGSVVSVPSEDPADSFDTRGLITDLVSIVGSITTVIVVMTR